MLTHTRTSRQQHCASLGNQLTCHTLLPTSTHSITHPNTIRREINKTPSSISEKNRETAERRFVVMVGETVCGRREGGREGGGCSVVVAVCSLWDEMWGLQKGSRKNKCRSWLRNSPLPQSANNKQQQQQQFPCLHTSLRNRRRLIAPDTNKLGHRSTANFTHTWLEPRSRICAL